jgi:hypothetical protein
MQRLLIGLGVLGLVTGRAGSSSPAGRRFGYVVPARHHARHNGSALT